MDDIKIKKKILKLIHNKTGWGNPLQPHYEFEDLYILNKKNHPEGQIIDFRYDFDEDGFSQYDKNHIFEGRLTIKKGIFQIIEFNETFYITYRWCILHHIDGDIYLSIITILTIIP